jgi:hypothetical protein
MSGLLRLRRDRRFVREVFIVQRARKRRTMYNVSCSITHSQDMNNKYARCFVGGITVGNLMHMFFSFDEERR